MARLIVHNKLKSIADILTVVLFNNSFIVDSLIYHKGIATSVFTNMKTDSLLELVISLLAPIAN